jgi:hypothetical protein
LSQAEKRGPAVVSHPVERTPPLRIARCIDHPQQGFTDACYAGDSEDVMFAPADAMCSAAPR